MFIEYECENSVKKPKSRKMIDAIVNWLNISVIKLDDKNNSGAR